MAVTATLTKAAVKMNLNNGTDAQTGEVKTVAVSLGSVNPTTYNAQKAMNIVNAIAPCLTKSVYSVHEVKTSTLTESL